MDMQRGIDKAVIAIVEDLKKRSKKVDGSEEIAQVGTLAANGDTTSASSWPTPWRKSAKKA